MNKEHKEKIRTLVENYIRLFPVEYAAVKKMVKEKRGKQRIYSSIGKGGGVKRFIKSKAKSLDRPLLEYSETLHGIFEARLTKDEKKYLKSKKGARWLANTFPEFRIPRQV